MSKRNILIKKKNIKGWDELYPITTAGNVKCSNGKSVESQMADNAKKISTAQNTADSAKKKADEAFTFASDGKKLLASAITGKGVSASNTDTFSMLANKIGQISTSSIKKIQKGIVSFSGYNDLEKYVGISSVNMEKSLIYYQIKSAYKETGRVVFKSNNTLFVKVMHNCGASPKVYWQIVEFSNVKSVQRGEFCFDNRSDYKKIQINPVNIEKSLIIFNPYVSNSYDNNDEITAGVASSSLEFLDNKTLELFTKYDFEQKQNALWQVIEFN